LQAEKRLSITTGDHGSASGLGNERFNLGQLPIPHLDEFARPRASTWFLRSLLQKIIRVGTLKIVTPDGSKHRFGAGSPSVTMRLSNWDVVRRLALNPELALGETYMAGTLTIEEGDIYGVLDLCLSNLGWNTGHWVQRLHGLAKRAVRRAAQHNPVAKARANVAHHYDLSDTLYELLLDADRQYSCAYFASPDDALKVAQERKMQHLAAKLLLRPGQRVLDIGSGWGGLGLYLARVAEVDVTGITLSTEQNRYAVSRANESGLADRVRFLLQDYRHESGRYDRIVSVGMFEHVGVGHYREYFEKVRDLLTDDGIALIHTIGLASGPGAAHPWIEKYIFPGGYTPALSEIAPVIERTGLYITDIEVLRLHYAETLKAWRQRFLQNRDRIAAHYDERFCRMWEFYLAGCEAGFRHSGLVVFQIQISKRIDAVPFTRDYIQDFERRNLV
jgi:cyclopropane-fatty-acyl-phospholipid synthase